MKKSLFILAASAFVLAGCNNDVTLDENVALAGSNAQKEIGFSTINTPIKHGPRRAPVHGAVFPDQDMYVAAYKAAPATAGNYFVKTTFSKNYKGGASGAGDNKWGGNPARFWPLSPATINFLAVTGGDINANHFTFDETNYASAATVAYTATNTYAATTQSDIMYSVGQGVVSQSNNTLTFNGGGSGELVGLTFNHALALLNFQVKAYSATEIDKIKINSITVHGASYTGTLRVTNANYAATDASAKTKPTITWTPDATVDAVVPGITSPYTLESKDDYYPSNTGSAWWNIMIVPSNTEGVSPTQRGFRSFTINYTVTGITGQPDQTYDYTYYPSDDSETDTNVAEGKIYTYKVIFKLHEIRIEPQVTDWSAESIGEITIQ